MPDPNQLRNSSTDDQIRGIAGSLWAAMTPAQRQRYRQMVQQGTPHELASETMTETIDKRDREIVINPDEDPSNPLQRVLPPAYS